MKLKLITEGGKMTPGPAVAQQRCPLGINLGKVIADINAATKSFVGVKVPVELDVDTKTKTFTVKVFSPPTAELIKKELGLEAGSGKPNTVKVGNIAVETLIGIAKTKQDDLLARNLKGSLSLMVGSCGSLGVLVDNKESKDIQKDIASGIYDKTIAAEKTVPSEDKKKELATFFKEVVAAQERAKKVAEEAAKLAEEAAAAAAAAAGTVAPVAGAAAAGATPVAGAAAAPADTKAAAPAAKDEKKKDDKKK